MCSCTSRCLSSTSQDLQWLLESFRFLLPGTGHRCSNWSRNWLYWARDLWLLDGYKPCFQWIQSCFHFPCPLASQVLELLQSHTPTIAKHGLRFRPLIHESKIIKIHKEEEQLSFSNRTIMLFVSIQSQSFTKWHQKRLGRYDVVWDVWLEDPTAYWFSCSKWRCRGSLMLSEELQRSRNVMNKKFCHSRPLATGICWEDLQQVLWPTLQFTKGG